MQTTGYSIAMARPTKAAPPGLPTWVREIRTTEGLTQAEFGARLRSEPAVHPTTITRWERGAMRLDLASIALIRKAFPGYAPPPVEGLSDPDRMVSADDNAERYAVKTDQGRIIAKAIDAIEDEATRTRVMRACLDALENPHELRAEKRPDRAQRK